MAGVAVGEHSEASAKWRDLPRRQRLRIGGSVAYLVLLTLLFIQPLARLMLYAAQSNLHSHILLVPLVAGYLLFTEHRQFPTAYRSSLTATVAAGGIGVAALAAGLSWPGSFSVNDELALLSFAFVCSVVAGAFLFFGLRWIAAAAFPVAFLIFMVPLPDAAADWLEKASVVASAEAAGLFFNVTETSVVRHGTVFELPGIVLRVGQECSGIRSSWVLFITSLLASHVLLRSTWRRVVLVALVIPLGILRNGFRILVIGLLCVHIGPQMIDSPIHHRGGPIFFALSLVPLLALAWWLRSGERPGGRAEAPAPRGDQG